MSNRLAIAAVTATLRNLLATGLAAAEAEVDLSDATVTAQPLDRARAPAATANQLNLFLYLIAPSAAWRNQDLPWRGPPGVPTTPPLPLNLFYLLSAYGRDNDAQQPFSHLLLGEAMSILNDHPLLGRDEVRASLPGNDLADQVERVRITLQPLSLEELSKLWAGFQMQFRLSVAYEVSVVLIDSRAASRAALPVLARGTGDAGYGSVPSAVGGLPVLARSEPARPLEIGETWRGFGVNLASISVAVRIVSPRLAATVDIPANIGADGAVTVTLPADRGLAAGPATVAVVVITPDGARTSNPLPLAIAPRITTALPVTVAADGGSAAIELACAPPVQPGQTVVLLLGDTAVPSVSPVAPEGVSRFVAALPTGRYPVRLRVDGIDSSLLLDPDASPPRFDPARVVEITA